MNKKVEIYTTPTCHFCHAAKEFFTKNNIEFTEHDVAGDPTKAQELVQKSGQMGVPVIYISWKEGGENKEEQIIGFDEGKLSSLLLGI